MTSRDAVLGLGARDDRDGGQAPASRAPRSAAAVHGAGGAGRHRARQRQPARLPGQPAFRSATASRSPSSCGSTAGAARCSWRRRATICGASCGCSIPSPPPRRSCASASRARSTRRGASTWRGRLARAFVKEVGRAAIDLYGGNLRVTPTRLRSHVTAASRARPGRGRGARGRAHPHPGGGADRRRQVEPGQRARQCRRGGRRCAARDGALHGLPADARGPAGGPDRRQPRPHRRRTIRCPHRGRRRLRHGAVGRLGRPRRARRSMPARWPPSARISRPSPTGAGRRCCWCSRTSTSCARSTNGSRPMT